MHQINTAAVVAAVVCVEDIYKKVSTFLNIYLPVLIFSTTYNMFYFSKNFSYNFGFGIFILKLNWG